MRYGWLPVIHVKGVDDNDSPPHHWQRRLLFSLLLLAVITNTPTTNSQNCPTRKPNLQAWPQGSTVYYNMTNLNAEQRRQVQVAFDRWNTANQSNNSGVTFSSATPPAGAIVLTVQIGTSTLGGPAEFVSQGPANGDSTGGTITFDTSRTAVNEFRYRAKAYGANHSDIGRWAYDVFLVSGS